MSENLGYRTLLAGEALAVARQVKLKSGTVTTPPEVEYCGAGEQPIGVTQFAAASGDPVTVRLRNTAGSVEIAAADSFAIGATLYSASAGKVSDSSAGSLVGYAGEAASGDGAIVEVFPTAALATTAAAVSIADTGGFTDAATTEAALAEIYQHEKSAQVAIPIPLAAITMEDGTALTKQATTVAGFAQLANKEQVIQIPIDCTAGETLGFSVPVPLDLDHTADLTIHVLAGKAANNDALTLDCEVYPVAAGDVANADIQDTAAATITQAASELTYTCGADGLLAAPGALTVVLALGGTNDGDAVYLYGVWIEYKRALLAA